MLSMLPRETPKQDAKLLLSMTAQHPQGVTTPQGSSVPADKLQHSPPPKDAFLTIKKYQRTASHYPSPLGAGEQKCQAAARTLRISSTLNPEQARALKMAIEACGIALPEKLKEERRPKLPKGPTAAPIPPPHTNYRRRQWDEDNLMQVNALRQQTHKLQSYKARLGRRQDPIRAIGDFYYTLGLDLDKLVLPDASRYQQMYGCTPGLQHLLDLQREEFDSVESLKFHWVWYRRQFRVFEFALKSYERIKVDRLVTIKVLGELRLDVYSDTNHHGKRSGYGTIACPAQQHFELDAGSQAVTRITSEANLVRGVAAIPTQSSPEGALTALHCLSEGFCISNNSEL